MLNPLAINGGIPIRDGGWMKWPLFNQEIVQHVTSALKSQRWTISGTYVDSPLLQKDFAQKFADFNGVRYCVPTSNGSSALVIALEALDIGPGDEVIVPVLTWVATASVVLRVNATPVFVDIDPNNLCMSVEAARAAITERTRAIIPVHLHHSMADMDAFIALSEETGIPLIEDTAQAHGAIWRGRKAGSIGRLGAFSFQQSKVLAAGEGGAVITDDPDLYERLQALRADSRRWISQPRQLDDMQLVPSGKVMGSNYGLSEIHAAILLAQLPHLEQQLQIQAENAAYLDQRLETLGCCYPLRQPTALDQRSVYEYIIRIDRNAFGGHSIERICAALKAELGLSFYPPDVPIHQSLLYKPLTKKRFLYKTDRHKELDTSKLSFPIAEAASRNSLICHHAALLGSRMDMDDIVNAFEKVLQHHDKL